VLRIERWGRRKIYKKRMYVHQNLGLSMYCPKDRILKPMSHVISRGKADADGMKERSFIPCCYIQAYESAAPLTVLTDVFLIV